MASYKIRTAGNCPAVLFTIWSPFNIRIGRGNSLPIRLLQPGHSSLPLRKLESDAEGRCSDGRSWRAILHRHDDYAASIRKSGPEIRNQCTQEGLNGKNLHRFASSGLKSRIDARKRVLTGKSLHRFPSSGLKSRIDARKWP